MTVKKTCRSMRWRIDYDYVSKLSTEEREWLEKFTSEYYRAELGPEPLHPPGEPRRDIYRRRNAAARDVVTAPAKSVAEAATRAAKQERPCLRCRYYSPADYVTPALIGVVISSESDGLEDKDQVLEHRQDKKVGNFG